MSSRRALTRYVAEVARPERGWDDLPQVAARSRQAVEELSHTGRALRFLRVVYLPEDESCLFVFDAESALVVEEAGRRIGLTLAPIPVSSRVA